MNRPLALLSVGLTAWILTSCASSSSGSPTKVAVPDEEARQLAFKEAEAHRKEFHNVLLKLDQAMESYARALANQGVARADIQREQIEKLIRDMVLDQLPQSVQSNAQARGNNNTPLRPVGDNFHRLQAAASDSSHPFHQGIALAALGFSERPSVMPTILQGAQVDEALIVDRAVFGLAILQAADTPPGVLGAVVENTKLPDASRTQAAWALYRLQSQSNRKDEIVALWKMFVTNLRETLPPGVIVQSVRGLGLTRDDQHADLVAPLLHHNTALVRMAAADALARMNSQRHADDLIGLLGPAESEPNVRLHARKALQELAGRVDYGYDVDAWRKAFERQ